MLKIKNRMAQERKMIEILNNVWWSEEIARNRKYKTYNTIVKNILTYRYEAWRMIEKEKEGLRR